MSSDYNSLVPGFNVLWGAEGCCDENILCLLLLTSYEAWVACGRTSGNAGQKVLQRIVILPLGDVEKHIVRSDSQRNLVLDAIRGGRIVCSHRGRNAMVTIDCCSVA
jgi:hypothetical protein